MYSSTKKSNESMSGTIASVTIVALVIILMWAGVFAIYMARV
ncbi:cytochrome c oxidase subunit 2A [Gracilibacillus salitolerans]|uniref:Cytochrome c oxidase subunit 2A n=1 Tax=Gracilibacillus salitolerans TaxID=2663022 RepID=A0A5Q2TMZ3_9BACI|nr:cytochrome c oxidase subunit 2A [Gracilibacillus salitolerans]QGH35472.1 cytochrome c oxidase subunit 2A [Gracilibacillus salitolerans]